MYTAGLAVECILQALALRWGAKYDARHDLIKWLQKCPSGLQLALRTHAAEQWSTVNTAWTNRLRYLSEDGLLGYLRKKEFNRGIRGGRDSVLKLNARKLCYAAHVVHGKGLVIWHRS
jgi:hypothetical protein